MADTTAPPKQDLRLLACDEDDLMVVSAHLQDASVKVAEIGYVPSARRFALLADRFDWCCPDGTRARVGLHFDYVTHVARQGFDDTTSTLNLLSITFTPGDAPSGDVILTFSGGAAIRLRVECIDAQMRDLGPRWHDDRPPAHALADEAADGAPE